MSTRIFSSVLLLVLITACNSSIVNRTPFITEPARAKNGMVVSENDLASQIGVDILKKGGNAVDAAVAVGFALAVTYPEAGNIGGGGFMILHFGSGKNTAIDFRETAPSNAFRDMYLNKDGDFDINLSTEGWTAAGVPGTVAGLIYALQKYGKLKLEDVIQPAIDLAENGFIVEYHFADRMNYYYDRLNKFESTRKIYVKDGATLNEGDLFVQKDLANTLKRIRDNGRDGFYKGKTAELIVEQSKVNGGYFTYEDLVNYKPIEKEPVVGNYKGLKIISMPPSSSGGIALVESLNILENFSFEKDEWNSSRYVHTVSEILKYVYADRSKHLGDEEYYDVPAKELLSKDYAKNIAGRISEKAKPSSEISPSDLTVYESNSTTHFDVVDSDGNAVSLTYTINGLFGNRVIVDGAGFFMNNEMDDFSSQPGVPNQFGLIGGEANSIEPGKRMLSSMTPTIVLKNEKPFLLLGARGGSRIITAVLQSFLNVVEFDMNINKAIGVPRFHHQWMPDRIDYEEYAFSTDVKENLISRGQNIGKVTGLAKVLGILIDKDGIIWGASDPRGEGLALGY